MAETEIEPLAGATPAGLPYPLATEPVAQGAAAIQALATAVDNVLKNVERHPYAGPLRHLESGAVSLGLLATGTKGGTSVGFTDAFAATPNVTVAAENIQDEAGAFATGAQPPASAWFAGGAGGYWNCYGGNISGYANAQIIVHYVAEGAD
jgi:hypothetical protein